MKKTVCLLVIPAFIALNQDIQAERKSNEHYCKEEKKTDYCYSAIKKFYNEKNWEKVVEYATFSCEVKPYRNTCEIAASYYLYGKFGRAYRDKNPVWPIDVEKGFSILTKGCEAKDYFSCLELGDMYRYNMKDGNGNRLRQRDMNQYRKYYEKACEYGENDYACVELADLYIEGNSVEKDVEKGYDMIEQTCLNGPGAGRLSCYRLGHLTLEGKRMQDKGNSKEVAIHLFHQACRFRYNPACIDAGKVYEDLDDKRMALMAYEAACKNDSGEGCYRAYRMVKSGAEYSMGHMGSSRSADYYLKLATKLGYTEVDFEKDDAKGSPNSGSCLGF